MFYHMFLKSDLYMHPIYFGKCLDKEIRRKLFAQVEGTCNGDYGFVIAITDIKKIEPGFIQPGQGYIPFRIYFKAVVLRPCKGEVFDAVVCQVNKVGVFAQIGPLNCFISRNAVKDMKFCPNFNPPCYKSDNLILKAGDEIRFRVIGLRIEANEMSAIGTLSDDYLGPKSVGLRKYVDAVSTEVKSEK